LGYNITSEYHREFLRLLEVDIYGGTPSQNLKEVLTVIEGKQNLSCAMCPTK
jgi:hypothetical protein